MVATSVRTSVSAMVGPEDGHQLVGAHRALHLLWTPDSLGGPRRGRSGKRRSVPRACHGSRKSGLRNHQIDGTPGGRSLPPAPPAPGGTARAGRYEGHGSASQGTIEIRSTRVPSAAKKAMSSGISVSFIQNAALDIRFPGEQHPPQATEIGDPHQPPGPQRPASRPAPPSTPRHPPRSPPRGTLPGGRSGNGGGGDRGRARQRRTIVVAGAASPPPHPAARRAEHRGGDQSPDGVRPSRRAAATSSDRW